MPVQENAQPQAETKQTNKERLKEITDSIEKGINTNVFLKRLIIYHC